jgi:hypothetical protein
MNSKPFHPQYGVSLHCEFSRVTARFSRVAASSQYCYDRPKYSHLGKKIKFSDLPEDCQLNVLIDYCILWDLEYPEFAHNHWRIILRDGRAKNYSEAKKMMEVYEERTR